MMNVKEAIRNNLMVELDKCLSSLIRYDVDSLMPLFYVLCAHHEGHLVSIVGEGKSLFHGMFKGCISPKDISCVSLSGKKNDTCCVFEGFVDFLSALVLRTVTDEDCLVLNSVSNLERSYAVLEGYGKIRCFLDRDRAGITALESLNIHFGNKVTDCSGLYDGFKDLNEYLTKTKENK